MNRNSYPIDVLLTIKRNSYFCDISSELICDSCSQVMLDPYQTDCASRCCFLCLKSKMNCPICNMKCDFRKDGAMEREICRSKIKCINDGCETIIMLKELEEHMLNCEFKKTYYDCIFGCKDKVTSLEDHYKTFNHQFILFEQITALRIENEEIKNKDLHKTDVENLRTEVGGLLTKLNDSLLKIDDLNERYTILQNQFTTIVRKYSLPYEPLNIQKRNGVITWTIPDIRKKVKEGSTLTSEAVYITEPGYKMAIKINLNGDGNAKDKYISVFFVIYNGQYDYQMLWPFTSKITMVIQSSKIQAHTENFKPDNNYSCYGRPKDLCNTAAGQPQFIRICDIDNYITNDCIIISMSIK